ncbi:hypothetical protein BG004_008236 [Podila humilis]|nr:hypothetical protein BG004_008236 [Podila humilis]
MSKALDPLKRLVGSLNARIASLRPFPANTIPAQPPQPLLHHTHNTSGAGATATTAVFKQSPLPTHFQVKIPLPAHRDGPLLLNHLHSNFNNFAKRVFLPEPARVAAVNYACQNAGRAPMASLLSANSRRMLHHQPLSISSVPRGFAKNVGLSSSRGFCSAVGPAAATNGPVRMMAQMYAKPLGALPSHANKNQVDSEKNKKNKSKRAHHQHRRGEIKKRSIMARPSTSIIKAVLARAAQVEQQHQMLTLCNAATQPITTAAAVAMAKVAGKTASELNKLPKLHTSEDCPTNVDMCFVLDASPLWHLDTMVSALHTDSLLRAPKQLNNQFIQDLLEITEYQYQHFLEVSGILQRLVQCPEAHEITLDGYDLRVHFAGTTLFDMGKFLLELGIDPKSPHFDLDEVYVVNDSDDSGDYQKYYPQASVNGYYYESSLMSEDTWDECASSSQISLIYESEFNTSVVSLVEMEPLPVQQSPWAAGGEGEGRACAVDVSKKGENDSEVVDKHIAEQIESSEHTLQQQQQQWKRSTKEDEVSVVAQEEQVTDIGMYLTEEHDPWVQQQQQRQEPTLAPSLALQESTLRLDTLSSQILGSTQVTDEYFDNIRGFLEGIEVAHRHADKLYGRQ